MQITTAKYENDMFLLFKALFYAFSDDFCYFKIHFDQPGPFKLIK